MKKLHPFSFKQAAICLILISFYSPFLLSQCTYTWILQSSGTTAGFNSVSAVSDLISWAAGENGTVRRTIDGGSNWLNANPNPGTINGNIVNIEATSENDAFVTTSPATNTYIYKTTNSGNNWIQVYSQTGGYINGINMISQSIGFAFGDPISNIWNILVTSDAGVTWLNHPLAPSAQVSEVGFDNCSQVSLPFMWFGASLGSVYRTTNNGLNWTSHPTPGINTYVFALHFNSQSLGLASAQTMVKSTDGGFTYAALPVPGAGNINGIEGAGTDFWYIRGQSIYRSTNSGDNWALLHTAASTLLDIDFFGTPGNCLTGWAIGLGGTIIKMTGTPLSISSNSSEIPDAYKLHQNYPNPFNPITTIDFSLPRSGNILISIYDVNGKEVVQLVNEFLHAGNHHVYFDASELSSGLYLYKIVTNSFSDVKKMILLK